MHLRSSTARCCALRPLEADEFKSIQIFDTCIAKGSGHFGSLSLETKKKVQDMIGSKLRQMVHEAQAYIIILECRLRFQ